MTRLPLDDHAAMYVAAGRRRYLPCIGVVRRFEAPLDAATLAEYAVQLAGNPEGFGRRVVPARLPGARARWEPARVLPPLRIEAEPVSTTELADLLDDEVSMQPDPTGAGWRMSAAIDSEGATTVLLWVHHAYGDGRGILETAFVPGAATDGAATIPVPGTMAEVGDVVDRMRRGIRGSARLTREAATVRWRRPDSDLARLGTSLSALRTRDRSVGARSQRRTVALARVPAEEWDAAAAQRGGSANALLLAVLANLLRVARLSRGETFERPLRLLLPYDIRQRLGGLPGMGGAAIPTTANATGAAVVVLPGGIPRYDSLESVRAATREALRLAAEAAGTAAPAPPGVIDAMQVLPSAITHRVAARVQGHVDGVASNVGPIPDPVARLGPHTASEVFLLAGPMLTDLAVCLGRDRDRVALGVVADPARLGPAGELRERLAEELSGWGLVSDPV